MKLNSFVRGVCCLCVLSVAACSSAGGESELETVAAAEEAIGSSSCAGVIANRVFTGKVDPQHVSSASYNNCFRGYVVDVNNLETFYTGTVLPGKGINGRLEARWAGPVPTTRTSCEAAWGSAIFYKKIGGAWVDQTGVLQSYGQWIDGGPGLVSYCIPPELDTRDEIVLETGASYRIAATMRTAYGGSTLRAIGFATRPKTALH